MTKPYYNNNNIYYGMAGWQSWYIFIIITDLQGDLNFVSRKRRMYLPIFRYITYYIPIWYFDVLFPTFL